MRDVLEHLCGVGLSMRATDLSGGRQLRMAEVCQSLKKRLAGPSSRECQKMSILSF
jgi:hypothetical protein